MLIDASINSASTMSKVELVDTHAHLNFDAFKDDTDEVIRRCLGKGFLAETKIQRRGREDWVSSRVGKQRAEGERQKPWGSGERNEANEVSARAESEREESEVWLINVGSHYESSQKAVEIAQKYPNGIFASVGLHPINLDTGLVRMKIDNVEGSHFEREFDYEQYKNLARSEKVVAIGEIGLDYYWKPKTTKKKEIFKQKQKDLLLKQLKLAKELDIPVIFHCRMAHNDLIEIVNRQLTNNNKQIKGVVHCFTGTWEQAQKYMEMGLYLGFNGLIFKLDFRDIIKKSPLERILIETDCPYLSPPASLREQALPEMLSLQAGRLRSVAGGTSPENNTNYRNEPIFVKYIAQEIAKIKNLNYKEITEITTQNAKKLFSI